MKKAMNLYDFSLLMFTTLANNSKIIDLRNPNIRIASLPSDYKRRINSIMFEENGWKEDFSTLINIEEFFQNHFVWEQRLSTQIESTINGLGKTYKYDFRRDTINVSFTQQEVDLILSNYLDENIKNTMDHFVSLLTFYVYPKGCDLERKQFVKRFNENNS